MKTQSLPPAADLKRLERRIAPAARMLKLLASEQRLALLCRLGEGEASAGELAAYAGLTQTSASQHLAKLRAEGVVATRREAQTIFYRLEDKAAVGMIDALCRIYGDGADNSEG